MKKELPLEKALKRHIDDISFHTPAHNGGILNYSLAGAKYDVTELSYSDNLHSPTGVIKESEENVARAYHTDNVIFSTAGATALIHAAIYSRSGFGDFLVYGNAHKSVYNAIRRTGDKGWFYNGNNLGYAIERSGAKTLIITSPDYYGNTLDLAEIKRVCDEKGVYVIVDASHGGHFAFSDKLPNSATEYFNTVIHSLHKTLPVLTGGAILHVSDKDYSNAMRAFREVHTTSPSYPVMASIESAVDLMQREGEALYAKVEKAVVLFRKELSDLPLEVKETDDFTRVVIEVKNGNASDIAVDLEKGGVYPECADYDKITLIVTPFNADKLKTAARLLQAADYKGVKPKAYELERSEVLVPLTFGLGAEAVAWEEAEGRVLYEGIGVYPPGTPIALPGERLCGEKAAMIKELLTRGDLSLFGLENGMPVVLK